MWLVVLGEVEGELAEEFAGDGVDDSGGDCTAVDRPVAVDGRVEIWPVVNLCFTFDHRFSDGLDMARAATEIRAMLEDPQVHAL